MAASTEERLTKLEVQYEKFSEQVLKQLDTILKRLDSMQSLNGNQSISIAGITERLRMHDDEIEKIWKEIMNLRKETKELSKSTTKVLALISGGYIILQIILQFIVPILIGGK